MIKEKMWWDYLLDWIRFSREHGKPTYARHFPWNERKRPVR